LAVAQRRTLLILDGVEPLQYPPGPLAGELRAAPPIPRLTEPLFKPPGAGSESVAAPPEPIPAAQWHIALTRLEDASLIASPAPDGSLLTLGRVDEAVTDTGRSVEHADRSGDAFQRLTRRTNLADALHQRGETGEARERFADAEAMKAEFQPQYPFLYSVQGFQYCDLLLARAERAAWMATGGAAPAGWALQACVPGSGH